MGREGTVVHGVRVVFTSCHDLKQTKIYVFALYYMFYIILAVSVVCTVGFDNSTCLLLRVAGRWRSTSLRALIREQR